MDIKTVFCKSFPVTALINIKEKHHHKVVCKIAWISHFFIEICNRINDKTIDMKIITATIFALAIGMGASACKNDVDKATECKNAATEYYNADAALLKAPSEATCEARNSAILNYRAKCEQLPAGNDTVNCSIKDNIDGLLNK